MVGEPRWWSRWVRWGMWLAFVAGWSAALLTSLPIVARDAVLPESYGFSAGKLLHVTAYAAFTVLTVLLPLPARLRWLLVGFVSLHAFGTEFLQQFVDRTPSWLDVGIDHLGIAAGLVVSWPWWRPPPAS